MFRLIVVFWSKPHTVEMLSREALDAVLPALLDNVASNEESGIVSFTIESE